MTKRLLLKTSNSLTDDNSLKQGIPSASHVSNNMSTPVLPAPTAAPGNLGTVQGPSSGNTSSSSHSKSSNAAVKLTESKVSVTVEASADSSKTDKKLQIQEKAAQEVKLAIKPFYQNKDITKEEYKEIVRKAVDKVCHSKSGEVNSTKVANLVKAYVDKYKYSRKGSQKKTLEEPVSTEKNIGWNGEHYKGHYQDICKVQFQHVPLTEDHNCDWNLVLIKLFFLM